MDIKTYEDLGRSTLTGRNSVGENVRNDATFDVIKSEINKLNTVSSAVEDSTPQWKVVANACEKVIKEESKDLLAGSYLSFALLEAQGLEGLLAGLSTILAMLNEHWEGLYPPLTRLSGRAGAMNWLCDSLDKYFDRHKEEVYDYTLMAKLKVLTGQIDDFLAQQQSDDLSFHRAVKLLDSVSVGPSPTPTEILSSSESDETGSVPMAGQGSLSKGVPKVFPDRASVSATSSQSGPDLSSIAINSAQLATSVTDTALAMLMRVSHYQCEQKEWSNVTLYVFKQVALWHKRYQYPKQKEGQTFIHPPDAKWVSSLEQHYQAQQYQDLLKEALSLMEGYPYWIDLIFYTVHALSHLGEAYQHAMRLMITLTLDWMQTFPMLKHYAFLGGNVPFARQETLDWIETTVIVRENSRGSSISAISDSFLLELEKVSKRSGQDQLQSVIALQHHLKSSMKEAHKIELLIKTIEVFVANREKNFLSNVVKQLSDKMEHFHLSEWDCDLAKKALIAMIHAKKLMEETFKTELEKLAEIDVGASIQLKKAEDAAAAQEDEAS